MPLKPLSSRQVANYDALGNIGSPADDTLDDILARINAILGGITGNAIYIAKEVALTSGLGTTSLTVSIPVQQDTSYVIYAIFENTSDSFPQFQQITVTNKTTTGFTFKWNAPLSSNNYTISYIVPFKAFITGESTLSLSATSQSVPVLQNGSTYGIISSLENYTDSFPQFQTSVVTAQSSSAFSSNWNVPTDSANYVESYTLPPPAGKVSIGSAQTSVTVTLPINYNTSSYAVALTMANSTDPSVQFQPMLVTAKTGTTFVVSWNVPTASANYSLYYYVISLTP